MPSKRFPHISNERLQLFQIPRDDAAWATIKRFARHYDPHKAGASYEDIEEIAKRRRPRTLHELRTCLYFEEQEWRFGHLSIYGEEVEPPPPEKLKYLRKLVKRVRDLVIANPPRPKPVRRKPKPRLGVRPTASREQEPFVIPEPLDKFDRLVLASYQSDKRRAAAGMAAAVAKALGHVKNRGGTLIIELDELLDEDELLVASSAPFNLPPNPVALCLTGSPRLVASVASNLRLFTKSHFVSARPPVRLRLRPAIFARDGVAVVTGDREFAGRGADPLAKTGWEVKRISGEGGPFPEELEAERILERLSAEGLPTPWSPPGEAIPEEHGA